MFTKTAASVQSCKYDLFNHLQKPERDTIRCSSGVKTITIFYRVKDSSHLESVQVNAETTSQNITNLETYTEYSIFMMMNNSVGTSKKSQHVNVYSPEEGLYLKYLYNIYDDALANWDTLYERVKKSGPVGE